MVCIRGIDDRLGMRELPEMRPRHLCSPTWRDGVEFRCEDAKQLGCAQIKIGVVRGEIVADISDMTASIVPLGEHIGMSHDGEKW